MFEKLAVMEEKFEEINRKLAEPDVVSDNKLYTQLMREFKSMTPIIDKYREYKVAENNFNEAKELLDGGGLDKDFKEMVQTEFEDSKECMETINQELKVLLLPKDPNDDKNVIIEIRGGAGGEEASLFANSLYRMYTMYAETKGWKQEILNANPTELGGFKEISFSIEGDGAYSRLKYESGVHRVQRVPETESQGRIQTSTATVKLIPATTVYYEETFVNFVTNDDTKYTWTDATASTSEIVAAAAEAHAPGDAADEQDEFIFPLFAAELLVARGE